MRQQTEMGVASPDALTLVGGEKSNATAPGPAADLDRPDHGSSISAPKREPVNLRSLTVWVRLFGLVRPVKYHFFLILALGLLYHGSVIILGAFTALLVGAVFRDEPLTTLIVVVCTLAPISGLLFYLETWQAHDMAFRLLARMRVDLYDKLEPLAPAYMVRRRSGDLVSVVGGDVETVEFFFAHAVSPMIVSVLVPGGVLIALGIISWPIAVVLAPFLVAVAVSPFFANSRIEKLGAEKSAVARGTCTPTWLTAFRECGRSRPSIGGLSGTVK